MMTLRFSPHSPNRICPSCSVPSNIMPLTQPSGSGRGAPTQTVTQVDWREGRIRIPRASKSIFPSVRCDIDITLRGESATVRWDPRLVPRERSGTLGIGRERLQRLVRPNEVLSIAVVDSNRWALN